MIDTFKIWSSQNLMVTIISRIQNSNINKNSWPLPNITQINRKYHSFILEYFTMKQASTSPYILIFKQIMIDIQTSQNLLLFNFPNSDGSPAKFCGYLLFFITLDIETKHLHKICGENCNRTREKQNPEIFQLSILGESLPAGGITLL